VALDHGRAAKPRNDMTVHAASDGSRCRWFAYS